MKKPFFFLLLLFPFQSSLFAQCGSGACPPGAINTLPAGGTIAAGDTYCLSGPINNTTAYTVNGTLIIQSGSVTVGDLTVGKTGSIIINGGAQLMANSYTGDATAPASVISNVTVCTNGYLYLSGAINPGETNFTVNDYGMFVIHGSWSTIIEDTWFKVGMGSIVEMCSSFSFKSSTGFFTETSGSPSYIVTRSAMANGAGGGYLSKLGAASQIMWDIPGGPVAWVTHPAANTCTGPTCTVTLPPGSTDNGVCGSVADSYRLILLPLLFLDVKEQLSGGALLITTTLGDAVPAEHIVLEEAADGAHFTPTVYTTIATTGNHYRFTLPATAAGSYHRIQVIGDGRSVYSKVLPPLLNSTSLRPGQTRVFPDPVTDFIYVCVTPDEKFTSATVIDCMGQVLRSIPLPIGASVVRCELPSSLPAGIYIIRLTGMGMAPLTVRVLKAP
ncbi:MAG TPA: T9SS type A sorting domain-containing protein [Puia sp.]|nr:T9SS type A sorting domain-containing protein [Puia sp.]